MVVMVSTVQWSRKVNDFAVKPFKNRPHFQLDGKAPAQDSQRGRNPLERGTKDEWDAGAAEGHTAPVVEIVSTQPGLVWSRHWPGSSVGEIWAANIGTHAYCVLEEQLDAVGMLGVEIEGGEGYEINSSFFSNSFKLFSVVLACE